MKTPKATPGNRPLMHFNSILFDTHPRFIQLKSLLLDFFVGQAIDAIHVAGIEHIISIQLGPTPTAISTSDYAESSAEQLPKIYIRTYTLKMLPSGSRTPRVELTPMGPFLDLTLSRHQDPDPSLWAAAMKKPKMKKQDIEKGLGKRKRNIDVDEMGDVRGRIHVGKQDLSRLQSKKMKGLKKNNLSDDEDDGSGPVPNKRRKS